MFRTDPSHLRNAKILRLSMAGRSNHELTDTLSEQITLYALGSLDNASNAEFEAHLDECGVCRQELDAVLSTLAEFAYSVPPLKPSAGLKDRLLESIQAAPIPPVRPANFASLAWQPSGFAGVSLFWLRQKESTGEGAAFIQIQPGCTYADHRHHGGEDCVVLQGGFSDRRGEYHAGDFVYYEPGSVHSDFQALPGETCILFVVFHGGIELLTTPQSRAASPPPT